MKASVQKAVLVTGSNLMLEMCIEIEMYTVASPYSMVEIC
jgi:hypothetical protein